MCRNSAVNRNLAGKTGNGYTGIRLELQKRGYHVGVDSVIALGVARSHRHRSSARKKGIVQMKYRRCVKRVSEFNLDSHSSNARYRMLHHIRDRCSQNEVTWQEKDDHSSIREGSMEGTSQHATVTCDVAAGAPQHDFMDTETGTSLYATAIRGPKMADGVEVNLFIVKVHQPTISPNTPTPLISPQTLSLAVTLQASKLNPSTPTQHFADTYMLHHSSHPEVKRLYYGNDGKVKPVCVFEQDGGHDENPSGIEHRFLVAEFVLGGPLLNPLMRRKQATAITREARGSPKNVVERLQGQATIGAAHFYHGPQDSGDLYDPVTGLLDPQKLKAKYEYAAERYRSELDQKPVSMGRPLWLSVVPPLRAARKHASCLLDDPSSLSGWVPVKAGAVSSRPRQRLRQTAPTSLAL